LWTGQTTIWSPLARVVARTTSRPGTGETSGSTAAVSEPTARKCEPKLLFIARSLPVPLQIKLYHHKSPYGYVLSCRPRGRPRLSGREDGYEWSELQETSAAPHSSRRPARAPARPRQKKAPRAGEDASRRAV